MEPQWVERPGLGMSLIWLNACLACAKPWVKSPALHKLGVAMHACEPSTQEEGRAGLRVYSHVWGSPRPRGMSPVKQCCEVRPCPHRSWGTGLPATGPQVSPDSCAVCWAGPKDPLVIIISLDFGAMCLCVPMRFCIACI